MASDSGLPLSTALRHAVLLAVQVGLAAVLCGLLLLLAERHNRRFDLTPTQSFVLADASRQVAEGLQTEVRVTAFYNGQEPDQRRRMNDVLQLFAVASPRITYRLLDLDRSPALANRYGVASYNGGVVEAENGETRELRVIDEEEIVNALLRLTRRRRRTVCFVTGHGEHSPRDSSERGGYSDVSKGLETQGFETMVLSSVPTSGVPGECTVLVLAGPSQDLLNGEEEQLGQYLRRAGQVLLLLDPAAPASWRTWLAGYGIAARGDVVVDERNRFLGADSFLVRVPIFDEGVYRKTLESSAVFSLAQPVAPAEEAPQGVRSLLLALTSQESFAHAAGGKVPDGPVQFRPETDRPGPLPVGAMAVVSAAAPDAAGGEGASGPESTPPGRLMVFGDSDFAGNLYLSLLGNKDLFLNSVGVLAEDRELVAVRRKGLPRGSLSPVSLTAAQGQLIFALAVVVVPGGFALFGMIYVWRRRRRADA